MTALHLSPKFTSQVTPEEKQSIDTLEVPSVWREFALRCQIRGEKGLQQFDPYPYQIQLIKTIHSSRMTIVTKTRQLGFTEAVANYFLWKACLIPGYLGVVFSKGQTDTSNIARRVRLHLESFGIPTKTNALTDIEIVGGGRIVFRNSAPDGARSLDSVWDILFDEAAFCKYIEEIYGSAQPTTIVMGKKARIIILSTPNGQSGWYWDKLNGGNGDRNILEMVKQIKDGVIDPVQVWHDEDGAAKFVCHWLAHPKYQLEKDTYLSDIKRTFKITEAALQQEYNLSFEMGETIVFEPGLVRANAIGEWEDPDPNYVYYGGLDTSLLGDDYTVFTVLKYDPVSGKLSLVAIYRARRKKHPVNIYYIGELIKKYRISKVTVETNGAGQIYCDSLSADFLTVEFIGKATTGSSKPVMINKLILALECEVLNYPNESFIVNEFLSFRDQDGKLEASVGCHDDVVMSLAINLSEMDIDFNSKHFLPKGSTEAEQGEAQENTQKSEELQPSNRIECPLFDLRVKLHSNYPNAANATDDTIKSLPGTNFLERDPGSGEIYIDSEGYATVKCEDLGYTRFALINQGCVASVED